MAQVAETSSKGSGRAGARWHEVAESTEFTELEAEAAAKEPVLTR